jgi:calcineurin-like phosphoesterase family protein
LHRLFFVSDHHFGHANIIRFCNRPFSDVVAMNLEMIRRWNEVVEPDDVVYHLGDVCLGEINEARYFFHQLNGYITVLPGNHDGRWFPRLDRVQSRSGHKVRYAPPIVNLTFEKYSKDGVHPRQLVLCHYPLWSWDAKSHGAWHLYGHIHNNPQPDGMPAPNLGLALNVCVELIHYRPISLEQVAERLLAQEKSMEESRGIE